VEFLLGAFGEVRPGEAPTVLLLSLNIFLLLTVYYLLKVAREPLILLGGGAAVFPIVGIGSSIGAVGGAALAGPPVRHGSPFLLMIIAAPVLVARVLTVARIAESTLDYSLSNTTRQVLWLVTSPEAKYKAKQVIDTFVMRAGDSPSAAVVWLGARTAMTTREFLAVNLVLALAWVGLALLLGTRHASRPTASGLVEPRGAPAMA
jgi:ATP/ADP translocase